MKDPNEYLELHSFLCTYTIVPRLPSSLSGSWVPLYNYLLQYSSTRLFWSLSKFVNASIIALRREYSRKFDVGKEVGEHECRDRGGQSRVREIPTQTSASRLKPTPKKRIRRSGKETNNIPHNIRIRNVNGNPIRTPPRRQNTRNRIVKRIHHRIRSITPQLPRKLFLERICIDPARNTRANTAP